MVKAIIAFIIADFAVSLLHIKIPFHSQRFLIFRPGAVKSWEQKSYIRRFCECFFLSLAVFMICLLANYYHEVNNPTDFEQMLIDGEAEYLVVFGDEYIGDADTALEIKQGHSPDKISKIISNICKEDYMHKGSESLYVYAEGDEYIIMDGDVNIGKVTTLDRKFGVVLRFYWN